MPTLHQKQTSPPWQSIALAIVLFFVPAYFMVHDTSRVITVEEAGGSLIIPTQALLCTRVAFAVFHFAVLVYVLLAKPHTFTLTYKTELGSQLKTETLSLQGPGRLYPFFTIWTYTAQGLFFALSALCSAALLWDHKDLVPESMLYATHLLFEMTAGCGFVVTVVVTFVLWPEKVREKMPHDLQAFYNMVMHNNNTFETVTELLFGRVPITVAHVPVGMVWGAAFIVFSWLHAPALARRAKKNGISEGNGGNFVYFFLDWTLPVKVQMVCYLGLLSVLVVFYFGAMAFSAAVLRSSRSSMPVWARALITYGFTALLFKWRD